MPIKKLLSRIFFIVAFCLASSAYAGGKIGISTGVYKIEAKTKKSKGTISNYGIYRLSYEHMILAYLSAAVGYTLLMSEGFGGDAGYGLDFGVNFYPLTAYSKTEIKSPNQVFLIDDVWKPYVGAMFSQRQFQSTQSGYSGFGFCGGIEYMLMKSLGVKAEGRYLMLTGGSSSTATEMSGFAGVNWVF